MSNQKNYLNKIGIYAVILGILILTGILSILLQWQRINGSILFVNYGNWFSEHPKNGIPPYGLNSCRIILGAKLIGAGKPFRHRLNGLSGAYHLFVNYFENRTRYGIIEGTHAGTNYGYGGRSFAWIRLHSWEHDGLQWTVPTRQCQKTIFCLKINTIRYHRAAVPYHFYFGPNSNSFIWWLFKECSMEIKPFFAPYPFVGIDYFWTHKFPSNSTATSPIAINSQFDSIRRIPG
jgi:hypothetical protein